VSRDQAARALAIIRRELMTPYGPRSLGPHEPGYHGHYQGAPAARDAAYHQGTVWPWWIGAYCAAWLAVHGDAPALRGELRAGLEPLLAHARARGGHVAELFDGDPPHAARGAPFQAWSLAELTRALALLA
jgi:glycogen debranching enzyme